MALKLNINRKIWIGLALAGLITVSLAFKHDRDKPATGQADRPNIIFILTDDQGYGDVGFNGCKDIPTPNIDRIARNGVVFTRGYVSYAVCGPSRAGLITGRYQDRFGYSRNPLYRPFDETIGLPLTEQTLPEYLQQSGYNTMGIGKWHLGVHEKYRPWKRGFNEFFGFLGGGHRYFPADYTIAHQDSAKNEGESYRTKLIRNEQVVEESEYLTDALTREAVSFIDRNHQQPFFIYLAYNAPHSPLQATPKYLSRFEHIKDPKRKTYAAMVSAVDDGVGRVLDKLQELGLTDNTMVIFLSDNGGPENDNASDNGPLRAGKGSLFEGGIRVPFAIQWPNRIKVNSRYDQPVISFDIFATIAANVKGAPSPKNKLDGVNLLPFLSGAKKGAPHEYLFWRNYDQKNYAVVHPSGQKEVIMADTAASLYDLKTDIGETTNIAAKNEKQLSRSRQERKKWESATVPPAFYGLNQEKQYEQQKKLKQKPSAKKPNIIVILIDDAGYADFGFMGSRDLQTPHLDRLARQSVRFTDAHVTASVCSPSRAGLLSGRYQQRFGYECNEGDGYTGLDTSVQLLPQLLQEGGYATAAFGKWHLGFEPAQHPLKKGFQYYYGFLSGGRSYFYQPARDDRSGARNNLLENYSPVKFDGYLTDVLGDKAADYIRQQRDQPFFMYWAPNAVHTPMEADSADLRKFAGHPRQKLAAMTFALDRAVGKMIDALKQQGQLENTLIFFLSDNGGAYNNQSDNFPLKGFKGNKYEAGHRVPFLLHWPAKIKGGRSFAGLSSSLDIFPTALEAAGIKAGPVNALDGVSLLPFMHSNQQQQPHQQLAWRKDGAAALRFNQYKLVRVMQLGERLYNLDKDPGETHDLQLQEPELFSSMKQQLQNWEKDKMKPIWTEGAVWDTITLMIHDDLMQNKKVRVTNPDELKAYRLIK